MLQETVQYNDPNNYGKRPTKVQDIFYSQFGLSYGQYRDSNNFIRHNIVTTDDHRWKVFTYPEEFQFIDVEPASVWYSASTIAVQ